MNDELRQKIAINYGLVLLGQDYGFVNFSFERPFCLYNKVYVENVSGGSYSYINENSSLRNTSIGRGKRHKTLLKDGKIVIEEDI